jgi:hypothetical protein
MASVPYLYIGYGSGVPTQEMWIDDLTLYRNEITEAEIRIPGTGGSGEEESPYIVIGNEDMTTPYNTAFSDLVTLTGDGIIHFGFYNHTNGTANWNNFAVGVTNGKNRGESGAVEYVMLRADAWDNVSASPTNITSNFNWDTFTTDMKDAYVDLTITRKGNRVDIAAVITTTAGSVLTMNWFSESVSGDAIGALLTCEGSYLEIDPETVYAAKTYDPGSYVVGPADLSSGFFQFFSNLKVIQGNTVYPYGFNFINNTNGGSNWNNWILVVTNGKAVGEAGYAEYFVLRADAYGWGDANYNGANISAAYNWEAPFAGQMKGANCTVLITRNGNRVDMTAKVTTATGERLPDYTFFYEGVTTDVGVFFTVEGASLDMRMEGNYPYIKATE